MKITLFSLRRQYKPLEASILTSWSEILAQQHFTSGAAVDTFEEAFAQFTGARYAVAVRSGTAALIVALKSLKIGYGDEVITTPCTFAATADAISLVGAKPIFADVSPMTGNLDPVEVEKHITRKTKAILVVHLYGVMADMPVLLHIAHKYKLKVIEDASHAHGSLMKVVTSRDKNEPKYKAAGAWGDCACFSLYPSKTLGAAGNAGIITTQSARLAHQVRKYAHHGISDHLVKYKHDVPGYNELIDTVQAAVLNTKLPYLSEWIKRRRGIAQQYNATFRKYGWLGMVWDEQLQVPSLYVYAVQSKNRTRFRKFLGEQGIETGVYYPIPLHRQKSYQHLGLAKGSFPKAEQFFHRTVALPLYPELTDQEISYICQVIDQYCQQSA